MRYIDPTLRTKLLLAQQTYYQNAEPHMEVIASRPRTPITNKQFWEEVIVTAGVTSVCTSVTVRKTGKAFPDKAYVAYVTDSNTLVVKSADIVIPLTNMIWSVEETISNCLACAVEFDGSFVRAKRDKVEFRTEETPWLFYVTSTGQLMAGVLGGSYESLVGANVTAVDAVRGVASKYKDIDQGLLVFYVIAGSLYYRDLIDGVWGDQKSVSIAPADIVSIRAERTFDYRIVLQVTDTSGALHEIFTKMESSGWNGTEYAVQLSAVTVSLSRILVNYLYAKNETEAIRIDSAEAEAWLMSIYSPVLRKAWNVPIDLETPYDPYDDDLDYGYAVIFEFNQIVRNAELYPADFKIEDAYGSVWLGQEVELNGRFVTVYFNNFNNAENSITATALAGNLSNGYTDLVETSVQFDAVNLVPTFIPVPEAIALYNVGSKKILIAFDREIISIGSQSGFVITGYEPEYSPNGDLISTDYEISSIGYPDQLLIEDCLVADGSFADSVLTGNVLELQKDESTITFETEIPSGFSGAWTRSTRAYHGGGYSLESNNKTHYSSSSETYVVQGAIGQTIEIWYLVSSEPIWDKLRITHNGTTIVDNVSGAGSWTKVSRSLVQGANTFVFTYSKDSSGTRNLDAAFIDDIKIIGGYYATGSYISPAIAITDPEQYDLFFTKNTPEDTTLTAYVFCNESGVLPESPDWVEIDSGESIAEATGEIASGYVWIKFDLTSDDPDSTPTVTSVYLEQNSNFIDRTIIQATLTDDGRMKHPQGDITVDFTGTLQGPGGGYVEPFSMSFTPQDIVPYFNPNEEASLLLLSAKATLVRTKVDYISNPYYEETAVSVISAKATAVRTHIDDIET